MQAKLCAVHSFILEQRILPSEAANWLAIHRQSAGRELPLCSSCKLHLEKLVRTITDNMQIKPKSP